MNEELRHRTDKDLRLYRQYIIMRENMASNILENYKQIIANIDAEVERRKGEQDVSSD